MSVENGTWIMCGVNWDHPECIHTVEELENYINDIGFLPLFANDVAGFSVEEWTEPNCWWCGDKNVDPWEGREIIASKRQIVYGKFFEKKAGFISLEWLPYFVNARRNGYDFSARWEDGLAAYREKIIMDILVGKDEEGDDVLKDDEILSTELKKQAGFGKNKEKNFPGIITGLQMQTYLVMAGFRRRISKKGAEYGMPVSILLPPEALWGYETVTSAYEETPQESWQRIYDHVAEMYDEADETDVIRLIGKCPI